MLHVLERILSGLIRLRLSQNSRLDFGTVLLHERVQHGGRNQLVVAILALGNIPKCTRANQSNHLQLHLALASFLHDQGRFEHHGVHFAVKLLQIWHVELASMVEYFVVLLVLAVERRAN